MAYLTAVFLGRYELGTFKKRVYLPLKGQQRTCSSPLVLHGVVAGSHHLPCDPNARLPCLLRNKKKKNRRNTSRIWRQIGNENVLIRNEVS